MAYANAMRRVDQLMEDDHIKIGENGLLYRIHTINMTDGGWLQMELYHAGDESRTRAALLALPSHTKIKVYNQ